MDAATILGGVGTAIGLVRALPQLARLLRTRDVHGVSVDTAATSSAVSFGWAAYGVLTGQPPVTFATGASGVVFALVAVLALRLGRRPTELRAAPVWIAVLLAVGLATGSGGLGVVLPLSVVVANVPQLVVAFRETDLRGLSALTWALSSADGLTWGVYALLAGDRSILVFGLLQVTTSVPIVIRRLAVLSRS